MKETVDKNIVDLLVKLGPIREDVEKKYNEEEKFNLFTCLLKISDEVKLHSRFISHLLNPHSDTELGDEPLKELLSVLKIENKFLYNKNSVEISPYFPYKGENNRIDILIIDKTTKYAIIIENKIYAKDSNHENAGQLETYYSKIKEKIKDSNKIFVYYLTIDGHMPSDKSLGIGSANKNVAELPKKVKPITYGKEIKEWCKRCLSIPSIKNNIRVAIKQYIKVINMLTSGNNNYEEMKGYVKEIIDIINKDEIYFSSAALLLENYENIKIRTIDVLFKEIESGLEKELKTETYSSSTDLKSIGDLVIKHAEVYPYVHFLVPYKNYQLDFFIGANGYPQDINHRFIYGLWKCQWKTNIELPEEIQKSIYQKAEKFIPNLWHDNNSVFVYTCSTFQDNINLWNFKENSAYKIMYEKYRSKVISNYISYVIESINTLIEKLNNKE